jgi:DNA-directed RNA polymerase specialized sigma24 family protein
MGHFRKKRPTVSMSKLADSNVEVSNGGEASFYVMEAEEAMMTDDDRHEEEKLLVRKHAMAENAIRSLPPLYRPYLEELLINEKSYAEIFDIMKNRERGINEQTVKNRIFNGRKMLQKQLMQTKLFSEQA